ncbi:hypothetical protein DFH28DRAFT_81757 [Melampsora americana]|nr:hypothetical protein DFH28DRAFT_81757 [Melampsora americana]
MILISAYSSSQILLFLFCHSFVNSGITLKRELKDVGYVGTAKPTSGATLLFGRGLDRHTIKLQDLRACTKPDLMTHGFTWVSGRDIVGREYMRQGEYQPHVEADSVDLVKKLMNTKLAICIQSAFRGPVGEESDYPIPIVHSDMSLEGAQWIKTYFQNQFLQSENQDKIQFGKYLQENRDFVILNVWRPIYTVPDNPLGLCAWNSLSKEDIMDISVKPTSASTATQGWKYHKDQKWFYLSNQDPDEVYVFIQHDSTAIDGHGINVPHAAFIMAKDDFKAQQRTSIECRVMAFVDSPLPDLPLPDRRLQ